MIIHAIRLVFISGLAVSIIPLGSARPEYVDQACLIYGVVFAAAVMAVPDPRHAARVLLPLLVVATFVAVYLLFQAAWIAGNPFANPVFAKVAVDLGLAGGAISIAPDTTLRSIPSLVGPFLVFGSATLLSQNDVEGRRTWLGITLLGIATAAFGLLRHFAFPDVRLFGQAFLDPGVVTSVFVNRNNAATFFGLAALATLGWLSWQWSHRRVARSAFGQTSPDIGFLKRHGDIALTGLGLIATILALLLTRSRAGVLVSLASLVGACVFIVRSRDWRGIGRRTRWFVAGGAGLIGLAGLALLAQQTILRAELGGLSDDRLCLYRETLAAIRDNWLWGTGFGTFEDVFPAYRLGECGIYGLPERAHNSYLEAYLGLGLPFVLLLIACLIPLASIYATGLRERRRLRSIPIVCLAALGLMLVHSAVDFPIQIHGIAAYFAALLGCGAGLSLARSPG